MQKGRKPRFQFIHTIYDGEWCNYCYEELKNALPLRPPFYKKVIDNRITKGFTESYQVQSRTDPLITWLEPIWYTNRIKKLPFPFLEIYLNELALAWWYQDDGHLSQKNKVPKKIIISTDNFTKAENNKLIELIARKFSMNFKLDGQNRLIIYDKLQITFFLRLIDPYLHPSMNRKKLLPNQPLLLRRRTTVYLPKNIQLSKPTSEINNRLQNLHFLKEIVNNRTRYIDFYKATVYPITFKNENENIGYQIVIQKQYHLLLQIIKEQTGLTISQIVTICFTIN